MDISIIIPAYNEEENLPSLVESLINLRKLQRWNCEIVVVDDNSSDSTGKIADMFSKKHKNITVIHRTKGNNGMGYALREGTKKAKGKLIIWTMADKSDDLSAFPKIIEKLKQNYDMVFGSRYMKGGSRGDLTWDKAIIGKGYTFITKILFGIPVHDITNAFRGFKKRVFDSIKLESGDFAISPELAMKAHLKGFKLGEVPVTYINRKAGMPKFKLLKMSIRFIKLFKYIFKRP